MITLAREAREWTQSDLAEAIGAIQGQISKYELGMLAVPEPHADLISKELDFHPSFLQKTDIVLALGGDFLYRRRAHLAAKVRRRVQAEANIYKMRIAQLLQSAEVREEFAFPAIQPEEYQGNVARIAKDVRKAWRIPPGPIDNVTRVIEHAGGIVFTLDFGTDLIDGTNIRMPGAPPLLFLNKNVPGDRHRFNLAHELAHAIMHYTFSIQDAEEEANSFAAEFLMPKSEIKRDLRNLDLQAALRLKGVWRVSMAAIIKRARDLKTITEYSYRKMFQALGVRGMRSKEPLSIDFEKAEVYDKLVEFHTSNLQLSDEVMSAILFTSKLGPIKPKDRPTLRLFDDVE